ncbi:Protein transport protein SEC31 [Balamuthia mandrillaris]
MLKQVKRNATAAWCPVQDGKNYLALGTVAGSIGDFSTDTALEVVSLQTNDSQDLSMPTVGNIEVGSKFHSLAWGQSPNASYSLGLIAGGMEDGSLSLWDPSKLVANNKEAAVVSSTTKHSGPVRSLDFNPLQSSLLVTAGSNSEIFIWDLTNPAQPKAFKPGAQVQHHTDIYSVMWNKKVQHILASASYNGLTVVWDLKAKKQVLSFADPSRQYRCKSIAWHPKEALQIATASEEDDYPLIQLWDLRNAYSPAAVFKGHTKGVWSLSWSGIEPNLLLSSGKDNELFCWNTSTAQLQCVVETTTGWNSNIQWSPTQPAILSTCSLQGQVKIFGLHDPTRKVTRGSHSDDQIDYSRPPQWMKRPVSAAFGFGGKLFAFGSGHDRVLNVHNVTTNPSLIERARRLQRALKEDEHKEFCDEKVQSSENEQERAVWSYLRVLFESTRAELLAHLGYDPESTNAQVLAYLDTLKNTEEKEESDKEKEEEPGSPSESNQNKEGPEHSEISETKNEEEDVSGLFGNDEAPSNLFGNGQHTEEENAFASMQHQQDESDPFAQIGQQHAANLKAQEQEAKQQKPSPSASLAAMVALLSKNTKPIKFDTEAEGTESMITRSLIVGSFESAVNICVKSGRMADALVLAACGGPDLWAKTQEIFFSKNQLPFMRLISSIVKNELQNLVAQTELSSWKATLAILCTYAKSEEFPVLCDLLASRLDDAGRHDSAVLCYICAGNVDKTVEAWSRASATSEKDKEKENEEGPVDRDQQLLELLEKVSIFRKAIDNNELSETLAEKYSQCAEILADQGSLDTALSYLLLLNEQKSISKKGQFLLDRVYYALPERPQDIKPPVTPFETSSVHEFAPSAQQAATAAAASSSAYGRPAAPIGGQSDAFFNAAGFAQGGPSAGPFGAQQQRFPPAPSAPSPFPPQQPQQGGLSPFPPQPQQQGGGFSPFSPQPQPPFMPAAQDSMGPTGMSLPSPGRTPAAGPFPPSSPSFAPAAPVGGAPSFTPAALGGPHPSSPPTFSSQPPPHSVPPLQPQPQPQPIGGGFGGAMGGSIPSSGGAQQPSPSGSFRSPPGSTGASIPPSAAAAAHVPAGKPSEKGQAIVAKLQAALESCAGRVASDARKTRALTDAKGRLQELFSKLNNNEYSAELEDILFTFATALESGDRNQAQDVHKGVLTKNHWGDLGARVMIGLKRLVETY